MSATSRPDGRQPDQLRPLKIELGVNVHAEGSCLIEMGRTRVWITASVEDRVPAHRRGSGQGWITAEYSMLPRSTHDRGMREAIQGRIGGGPPLRPRLSGPPPCPAPPQTEIRVGPRAPPPRLLPAGWRTP